MHERVEQTEEQAAERPAAPPSLLAAPSVGAVTALQRTIGNRATVAAPQLGARGRAGPPAPARAARRGRDGRPAVGDPVLRGEARRPARSRGGGQQGRPRSSGRRRGDRVRRHTVESHVREALAAYEANLGSTSLIIDQAMMVAGVVNAAGRAVAQAINDPGLAPMFAREIMRVHRDEMAQKLLSGPGASARERGKVGGVVEIASVLAERTRSRSISAAGCGSRTPSGGLASAPTRRAWTSPCSPSSCAGNGDGRRDPQPRPRQGGGDGDRPGRRRLVPSPEAERRGRGGLLRGLAGVRRR